MVGKLYKGTGLEGISSSKGFDNVVKELKEQYGNKSNLVS